MIYFWLDASAVVKRYIVEPKGTPEMQYFFNKVPSQQMMICDPATVGEVRFIFVKYKNREDNMRITAAYFDQIKQLFETEVSQHPEVIKVSPTKDQTDASLEFIEEYSINSTDAIILRCALDKAGELRTSGHDLILVSSDERLLRAAQNEKLLVFNPETDTQTALDVLIGPL